MTCPICKKPTIQLYAPFCSKHCKNIDLLRWTKEEYRIPTQEEAHLETEMNDPETHLG